MSFEYQSSGFAVDGIQELSLDEIAMIAGGDWSWVSFGDAVASGAVAGAAGGAVAGGVAAGLSGGALLPAIGIGAAAGAIGGAVTGGVQNVFDQTWEIDASGCSERARGGCSVQQH